MERGMPDFGEMGEGNCCTKTLRNRVYTCNGFPLYEVFCEIYLHIFLYNYVPYSSFLSTVAATRCSLNLSSNSRSIPTYLKALLKHTGGDFMLVVYIRKFTSLTV